MHFSKYLDYQNKKNMAKKVLIISIIVLLTAMFSVAGYFIYNSLHSGETLSIVGLYNADKQLIKEGQQSVVGGVEGVKYITLKVEVENKDSVPLNFKIIDASPLSFKNALTLNSMITAEKDQKASWVSGLVDIELFENTTQEFSVTIEASSPSRDTATKTSSINIKVDPDPQSSFNVVVTSEINNNPNTNPSCTESWTCGAWGTCTNSQQSRTCTDANNCGTTTNRPALTQSCTAPSVNFETNANPPSDYTAYKSGTYVKADTNSDGVLEQYTYSGLITAGSCSGSLLLQYSGLNINKYSGSQGISVLVCNPSGSGYKKYQS